MGRWSFAIEALVVVAWLPVVGSAQTVIDFETVPGGTPADQLAISTQYLADFGVTFSLEGGGTPYLEQTGASDAGHGFYNVTLATYDVESTGHTGELGSYFLRFGTTTFSPAPGPVLVIEYATPVSGASGEIWDIDAATGGTNGYEAWTITARDAADAVIDTVVSPNGIDESLALSLNGKPWLWSFAHGSPDIHSIAIQFTGTATLVGLAFDNFTPSVPPGVPIGPVVGPGSILLAAVLGMWRLRARAGDEPT